MSIFQVRYSCITSEDPTNLTVSVPTSLTGGITERTLVEGDAVVAYGELVESTSGPISSVLFDLMKVKGGKLVVEHHQPEPGDMIVVTCAPTDVGFLAGSVGVVAEDGSVGSVAMGTINGLIEAGWIQIT